MSWLRLLILVCVTTVTIANFGPCGSVTIANFGMCGTVTTANFGLCDRGYDS